MLELKEVVNVAVIDGRTWLEVLPEPDCWRRLADSAVGRLAVNGPDGPEIFPVNHAVLDGKVVFRTDPGTKLTALLRDARVAYEVDEVDHAQRSGWSVLVVGAVEPVPSEHLDEARALPLEPWTIGDKVQFLWLRPRRISGRAIRARRVPGEGGDPERLPEEGEL